MLMILVESILSDFEFNCGLYKVSFPLLFWLMKRSLFIFLKEKKRVALKTNPLIADIYFLKGILEEFSQ